MSFPIEYGFGEFALIISAVDRLQRFLASHNIEPNGGLFDPNGLADAGNTWAANRWNLSLEYHEKQYRLDCRLTINAYPFGPREIPHSIQTTFLIGLVNESMRNGVFFKINRETGYFEPGTVLLEADHSTEWAKPFAVVSDNLKGGIQSGQRAEEEVFSAIAHLLSS